MGPLSQNNKLKEAKKQHRVVKIVNWANCQFCSQWKCVNKHISNVSSYLIVDSLIPSCCYRPDFTMLLKRIVRIFWRDVWGTSQCITCRRWNPNSLCKTSKWHNNTSKLADWGGSRPATSVVTVKWLLLSKESAGFDKRLQFHRRTGLSDGEVKRWKYSKKSIPLNRYCCWMETATV